MREYELWLSDGLGNSLASAGVLSLEGPDRILDDCLGLPVPWRRAHLHEFVVVAGRTTRVDSFDDRETGIRMLGYHEELL